MLAYYEIEGSAHQFVKINDETDANQLNKYLQLSLYITEIKHCLHSKKSMTQV